MLAETDCEWLAEPLVEPDNKQTVPSNYKRAV